MYCMRHLSHTQGDIDGKPSTNLGLTPAAKLSLAWYELLQARAWRGGPGALDEWDMEKVGGGLMEKFCFGPRAKEKDIGW